MTFWIPETTETPCWVLKPMVLALPEVVPPIVFPLEPEIRTAIALPWLALAAVVPM